MAGAEEGGGNDTEGGEAAAGRGGGGSVLLLRVVQRGGASRGAQGRAAKRAAHRAAQRAATRAALGWATRARAAPPRPRGRRCTALPNARPCSGAQGRRTASSQPSRVAHRRPAAAAAPLAARAHAPSRIARAPDLAAAAPVGVIAFAPARACAPCERRPAADGASHGRRAGGREGSHPRTEAPPPGEATERGVCGGGRGGAEREGRRRLGLPAPPPAHVSPCRWGRRRRPAWPRECPRVGGRAYAGRGAAPLLL